MVEKYETVYSALLHHDHETLSERAAGELIGSVRFLMRVRGGSFLAQ
jgi:hypothetical protein